MSKLTATLWIVFGVPAGLIISAMLGAWWIDPLAVLILVAVFIVAAHLKPKQGPAVGPIAAPQASHETGEGALPNPSKPERYAGFDIVDLDE